MTHEVIETIPFQPPSEELLELLRACEQLRDDMYALCAAEWNTQELYGFGELSPAQTDRLLSL